MVKSQVTKTGTTCIGVKYKDGIILATDRRVTRGGWIADDDEKKFSIINKNVATTWAGTASDAIFFSRIIKAEVALREANVERELGVEEVAMIINNIQYKHIRTPNPVDPVVGYIIGGYDKESGFRLFDVGPDGTIREKKTFGSDGSGSIFIDGLLKSMYKENMTEKEAIEFVQKGVLSAISSDNASGGGVVMLNITKDGVKELPSQVLKSNLEEEN